MFHHIKALIELIILTPHSPIITHKHQRLAIHTIQIMSFAAQIQRAVAMGMELLDRTDNLGAVEMVFDGATVAAENGGVREWEVAAEFGTGGLVVDGAEADGKGYRGVGVGAVGVAGVDVYAIGGAIWNSERGGEFCQAGEQKCDWGEKLHVGVVGSSLIVCESKGCVKQWSD